MFMKADVCSVRRVLCLNLELAQEGVEPISCISTGFADVIADLLEHLMEEIVFQEMHPFHVQEMKSDITDNVDHAPQAHIQIKLKLYVYVLQVGPTIQAPIHALKVLIVEMDRLGMEQHVDVLMDMGGIMGSVLNARLMHLLVMNNVFAHLEPIMILNPINV